MLHMINSYDIARLLYKIAFPVGRNLNMFIYQILIKMQSIVNGVIKN